MKELIQELWELQERLDSAASETAKVTGRDDLHSEYEELYQLSAKLERIILDLED